VDGGVIMGTMPLVSAAVAIAVLGERPGKATLLAIATAAAGVWLMTHGDAASGAG
jgi:drug/metabolite transporter (DMT)-like permease